MAQGCTTAPHRLLEESDRMRFTTTKLLALIACGLMLGASATSAAEPITDLPKALAAAKAQGKPIFIYVFDSL